MSIIEVLKSRRAIRKYEARKVEKEKIEQLLEAATWAPNDGRREPWSFYVIQGEAKVKYEQLVTNYAQERFPDKPHLVEASVNVVKNTPLLIVVTVDIVHGDEGASKDNEYAVCCAIHSMWLAAQNLGLGCVWRTRGVGLIRDERLCQFLNLPKSKKMIGNLFIGYPDEEATRNLKAPARTSFEEKTTWL